MGLKDEVEGKTKEAWGKATGDDKTEAEGKVDQAKGEAKDAVDDVKDAASAKAGRRMHRGPPATRGRPSLVVALALPRSGRIPLRLTYSRLDRLGPNSIV